MARLTRIAVAVLALAATSPARAQPGEHGQQIWTAFDSVSGYGSVELRPMLVSESPPLRMRVVFIYRGRRPAEPPASVRVALVAGELPSGAPPVVAFAVASATVRPAEVSRTPATLDGRAADDLAFRLDAATFRRIAGAPEAAVVVGGRSFALGAEQRAALRDVASRLTPAGFDRALRLETAVAGGVRKDVYDSADVDRPARVAVVKRIPAIVSSDPAARPRRVLIEFVVDTAGRVDPATLRGRFPERDAAFVALLQGLASEWEYWPALRRGRPVAQRVRQAFVFDVHRPEGAPAPTGRTPPGSRRAPSAAPPGNAPSGNAPPAPPV